MIGQVFDPSIFGGPSYRLTARHPFQASPAAWLSASHPAYYVAEDDTIVWQPPRTFETNFVSRGLRFYFDVSPDRRSLISLTLSGYAWPGTTGHVLVQAFWGPASVRIPIGESFGMHTFDLAFVPLGGRPTEALVTLEAGIQMLTFHAVTFRAEPPVLTF